MSVGSGVRLSSEEARLVDRIVFKFENILRSFNKSSLKYVARLEYDVFSVGSGDRRLVSFTVYVYDWGARVEGIVEDVAIIKFYYDLTGGEGAFSGIYCDDCWLSPEGAVEVLDLARQLASVFYGGVVL
jgi:hypothetical protein